MVSLLAMAGCAPEGAGCGTAWGDPATDTVQLNGHHAGLEVRGRVEVHWWPTDSLAFAVRHGGSGILDGISVVSEGDRILIEDNNVCHWVRRLDAVPRVDLHGVHADIVKLLSQADFVMESPWQGEVLSVEGDEMAGDVDLWFLGDSLRVRLPNGIAHTRIRGEAARLSAFRSGFGDLQATQLDAAQVLIHHAGVGEVRLRPEGYLFLELAGPGDVVLEGPGDDRDIVILPGATGEVVEWP